MPEEIKIPAMGESLTEATIASLLKPSGSVVREGEEIVELETEKVNQVLYAPVAGMLTWTAKEGETFPIGAVIGTIEKTAEKPSEKPEVKKGRVKKEEFLAELKATPSPPPEKPIEPPEPTRVTPLQPKVQEKGRETRRPISKIRKTIAKRLVDALHQAAMLTTFNEVDMSAIAELRTKYKESFAEKHGVKLGLMSFFVKAVVEGLKNFPDVNSYIDGDEIVHREYYDIGIAVSTDRGLVVPVIRDCDKKSFGEIEKEIADFAKKARSGKLSIEDLQGGGFTITNGGVFGSLLSTPILNPPQSGILGMHAIIKRPVAINDAVEIRPMMYLALSYDHRIVDGKEAISFLVHVRQVLEDPSRIMFLDSDGKI